MKRNVLLLFSTAMCFACSSYPISEAAAVPPPKEKVVANQDPVKKENLKNSPQTQTNVSKASSDAVAPNENKLTSRDGETTKRSPKTTNTDSAQNFKNSIEDSKSKDVKGNFSSAKNEKVASSFKKIENKGNVKKASSSVSPGIVRNGKVKPSQTGGSVRSSNFTEVEPVVNEEVKSAAPESWTIESENTEPSSEGSFDAVKQPSDGNSKTFNDAKWLLYGGVGLVIFSFLCATFFIVLAKRRLHPFKKSRTKKKGEIE